MAAGRHEFIVDTGGNILYGDWRVVVALAVNVLQ